MGSPVLARTLVSSYFTTIYYIEVASSKLMLVDMLACPHKGYLSILILIGYLYDCCTKVMMLVYHSVVGPKNQQIFS